MRWYSPEFILLFALIPLIIGYKLIVQGGSRKGGIRYPMARAFLEAGPSWRVRLLWLPEALRVVTLALLIMSLIRPQYGLEQDQVNRQGIDIMICLDVSGSMAAEDFTPTRLKAAQEITERFINGLTDHRLGLVVFAGLSLTQCPLTLDYGVITELLRKADLRMIKADGTAIGDAIINAVYKFKKKADEKRDQIIILLTDGENNAGAIDPLSAAKVASEKGIRIYTIGVGSLKGAPIPVDTPYGKQYAMGPDGTPFIPKLDEQLLKDIAFMTRGQYFRATDNSKLEKIYTTIASLEKGKIDITRTMQYSERFYWFLAPALALFCCEMFLRARVFARVF